VCSVRVRGDNNHRPEGVPSRQLANDGHAGPLHEAGDHRPRLLPQVTICCFVRSTRFIACSLTLAFRKRALFSFLGFAQYTLHSLSLTRCLYSPCSIHSSLAFSHSLSLLSLLNTLFTRFLSLAVFTLLAQYTLHSLSLTRCLYSPCSIPSLSCPPLFAHSR
jgi:hypothetical protein